MLSKAFQIYRETTLRQLIFTFGKSENFVHQERANSLGMCSERLGRKFLVFVYSRLYVKFLSYFFFLAVGLTNKRKLPLLH